jgi:hypothetical protein
MRNESTNDGIDIFNVMMLELLKMLTIVVIEEYKRSEMLKKRDIENECHLTVRRCKKKKEKSHGY